MGHKKRNPVARGKQSPAADSLAEIEPLVAGAAAGNGGAPTTETEPSAVSDRPSPSPSPTAFLAKVESSARANRADVSGGGGVGSASFAAAKLECEKALTALRRGNHKRALRLMKETCQQHENSPHYSLIQRVHGTVCVKVASLIDDPNTKNRHLKNALEAARRAAELSPNSIEFAHFHANLLYEVANEPKEYEEAVRECERGLAIEKPNDPAKDTLQEEGQQKGPTVEARIGQVQNDLRQLIQKSNIASISSWMKNLGNGDDKFRLIPIRRLAEDPMEVRLVQPRRPNEIKRTTKTPEERRREIEVRVAAARLIQQKSEVPQLENGLDPALVTGPRAGDRRRINTRKSGSSAERRDFVRSFWNSISIDVRRELLRIKVSDLKEHFGSSKDGLAYEVLSEALLFADTNRTWKFWDCCKCNERSVDSESHMRHLINEHMETLLPKLHSVLPQTVDDEWGEMLLNCSWKPLDVSAAVRMLRNQSKCNDTEFLKDMCSVDHDGDFNDCFKETWESSLEKENLGENCTDCNVESTNHEKIPKIEPAECLEENVSVAYAALAECWPVSDDSECAKLLERIHTLFEVLIKHKCLAASHLTRLIHYTIGELQNIPSGSELLNHGIEQSPMCICFLGDTPLRKILKYLQDLSVACGFGRYPDKNNNMMEDAKTDNRIPEIKERIVLSADSSVLLLDEGLLSAEFSPSNNHHDASNNATGANVADVNANGVVADSSGLLSWIFGGPTSTEELASWTNAKEEKASQAVELLLMIEKEFYHLQSLCERKCERLSFEEALQAIEEMCVEEGKRRENTRDLFHQSFDSILKKRREELLERENGEMFLNIGIEVDAITQVLKEAENVSVNQFGLEETYGGVNSHLCDLESGEDDDWRAKDYLQQVDTCIEVGLQRQKDQLYEEFSKIDARLLRTVTLMQQLELKLEPLAANDFRSILLPLMKSYLRAHLEDLAEKDATEKSDAIREALLAELDRDSKKATKGGNDNSRQAQEKTKDRKKIKDYKKPKESKVTGVSDAQAFPDETEESLSIPITSDGNHPDLEIVVPVDADDLKHQEEELKQRIELEAEERKLQETLEYQRRIEDEAKQKHLAEQLKKANQIYLEKGSEELDDLHSEPGLVDIGVHDQLKPPVQENYVKNHSVPAVKSATVSSTQTSGKHQDKVQQGLANEGVSEDGYLPSDRRVGKRGRRPKTTAKVFEGKHVSISSPKENVESRSCLEGNLKEGDKGVKSLRQLQAEEDEERFLADLEKAVQQSLDTFQAHQNFPSIPSVKTPPRISEVDNGDVVVNNGQADKESEVDVVGTGLKNEVGEYNCFLNVIIQSLWHIKRFRDEFLIRSTSGHVHVGEPCVVCALYGIFSALNVATAETREAVAPTSLRVALSNLYPDSNFFQEAQMNDASEVLLVIFDCLHRSFTPGSSVSDTESVASSNMGSWDCTNTSCIVHSIFGMDIFERMNCTNCELESRHLKYTSFFHNINASALRTMKDMCPESSFDVLLNLVEMNYRLACDTEAGGCGEQNHIHHILSSSPHVFTTVVGWQNTCESIDDIIATLAAFSTEIDVSFLYRGLDPKKYNLISVVCYYGQHYHCFAYSRDNGRWVMYDDKTVKVIGSWADVLATCERGHLQPQVLFFESVY